MSLIWTAKWGHEILPPNGIQLMTCLNLLLSFEKDSWPHHWGKGHEACKVQDGWRGVGDCTPVEGGAKGEPWHHLPLLTPSQCHHSGLQGCHFVFLARWNPNLMTVIPAMSHIEEVLKANTVNQQYSREIQVALTMGQWTLTLRLIFQMFIRLQWVCGFWY